MTKKYISVWRKKDCIIFPIFVSFGFVRMVWAYCATAPLLFVQAILIALWWLKQSWFASLLQIFNRRTYHFPLWDDILLTNHRTLLHHSVPHLKLTSWLITPWCRTESTWWSSTARKSWLRSHTCGNRALSWTSSLKENLRCPVNLWSLPSCSPWWITNSCILILRSTWLQFPHLTSWRTAVLFLLTC